MVSNCVLLQFEVSAPDQVLVTDITYIKTYSATR